jgi:hypothetical protein
MKIKPYPLLLLLCLFCQGLKAQDSLTGKRLYLGLSFSSYHEELFINHSTLPVPIYGPKTRMPFRAGVDLKIKITPRFSLCTGLVIDIKRMEENYRVAGNLLPGDISHIRTRYRTLSAGLPVRADFRCTKGKVAFFVTGGWYTSLAFEQSIRTDIDYADGRQTSSVNKYTRTKDDKQLLLLMQLGGGLDVELKRFKMQLFPLYEGGTDWAHRQAFGESVYQHRIGAMLSVYYRL